jgi:hypothetical protein
MSQVGHADSKMTLDVYAQLEQRIKRDHGRRFDESSAPPRSRCTATILRTRRPKNRMKRRVETTILRTRASAAPERSLRLVR